MALMVSSAVLLALARALWTSLESLCGQEGRRRPQNRELHYFPGFSTLLRCQLSAGSSLGQKDKIYLHYNPISQLHLTCSENRLRQGSWAKDEEE
jgi:hypothetical protein